MWSGQSPLFSLSCPAILVLEFWSIQNESPIALPCVREGGTSSQVPKTTGWLGAGLSQWLSVTEQEVTAAIPLILLHITLQQDSTDSPLANGLQEWQYQSTNAYQTYACFRLNVSSVNTSPMASPEFMWKNYHMEVDPGDTWLLGRVTTMSQFSNKQLQNWRGETELQLHPVFLSYLRDEKLNAFCHISHQWLQPSNIRKLGVWKYRIRAQIAEVYQKEWLQWSLDSGIFPYIGKC